MRATSKDRIMYRKKSRKSKTSYGRWETNLCAWDKRRSLFIPPARIAQLERFSINCRFEPKESIMINVVEVVAVTVTVVAGTGTLATLFFDK